MEIRDIVMMMVSNVAEGMVITDAHLDEPGPVILYTNKVMERLTGYTIEEMKGRTPRVLQGEKTDKEQRKWMKEEMRAGRSVRVTIENYRKDGTTYWVDLQIHPVVEAGIITHYFAIQRDVSREKELEFGMAEQAGHLGELGQRLEALLRKYPEGK